MTQATIIPIAEGKQLTIWGNYSRVFEATSQLQQDRPNNLTVRNALICYESLILPSRVKPITHSKASYNSVENAFGKPFFFPVKNGIWNLFANRLTNSTWLLNKNVWNSDILQGHSSVVCAPLLLQRARGGGGHSYKSEWGDCRNWQ